MLALRLLARSLKAARTELELVIRRLFLNPNVFTFLGLAEHKLRDQQDQHHE